MTISSETNRVDYTGDDSTATYNYTFRILNSDELLVTQRDTSDVESTLTLTTDYTVAGVNDLTGGSITLTAGNLASGVTLTIRRYPDLVQETDIRNQGSAFREAIEDACDRLVMIDQRQQDAIDRSLKLPETVAASGVDPTLPVPQGNRAMRWNASGTALENFNLGDLDAFTFPGTGGLLVYNVTQTLLSRTMTGSSGITIDNGDGVSGAPNARIAVSGVGTTHLQASSVTGAKLPADVITADKMGASAVATASIQASAVSKAKLQADVIDHEKLDRSATFDFASGGGTVRVTTQSAGDDSTLAASTAFVQDELSTFGTLAFAAASGTTVGDTTTETPLCSGVIAGGRLGTNGAAILRTMRVGIREDAGGAPTVTFKLVYGSDTVVQAASVVAGAGAYRYYTIKTIMANTGATNVQAGHMTLLGVTGPSITLAQGTGAVDSTADQVLKLTATWSGAPGTANSITCDNITVQYLSPNT